MKAHLIELNDIQQGIVAGVAKKRGTTEAEVIESIIEAFFIECKEQIRRAKDDE